MECKYKTLPCLPEKAPGINRYIMECKFKNQVPVDKEILELIDTLWNVNVSTVIYGGYPVKKINRYIIE